MKTCFFMGHRDAPYQVEACLRERVVQAVTQDGVTDFVVGLYGNLTAWRHRRCGWPKNNIPLLR